MSESEPLMRGISDTARWVAMYRAYESERRDAIFHDPFARRLAGARGEAIANALPFAEQNAWSWTARTYLFDRIVADHVRRRTDLVVNLAAGLDARPYRMDLPSSLRWVEVDLPEILDYKREMLADAHPACALERVRLDLADVTARRDLFNRLAGGVRRALVLAEGLLIYLSAEEVASLAQDLAAVPAFERWAVDIVSPGLLRMLQERLSDLVREAGASYRFAPAEGADFFLRHGWRPIAVHSLLKTARRLRRLPMCLRVVALLPERRPVGGNRPWGGVCLLDRQAGRPQ